MNKTFATFGRALKKDRYLESIQAHFLLLPSYRRFPKEEEFKRELKVKDLYNFRSRSYWLRRLENHGRKERVPVISIQSNISCLRILICPNSGKPNLGRSGSGCKKHGYIHSVI